ncbi:MAG: hypothetical protein AB8B64_10705 [Granulosicoccus sp.]
MVDGKNIPEISSTALSVSSSNFETRRVQFVNKETLLIRPSIGSLAFSGLFIMLGVGLAGFWVTSTFTAFEGPGSVPLLLIGVLFVAAGLWTYYGSNEQLVFNRTTGAAFIRSWRPSVPLDTTFVFRHIPSQDIIAIQTISRVVKHRTNRSRRSSSYTEYQVNVCTSDHERHNALVTLKSKKAEALGVRLSQMFSVPLSSH